MSGRDSILSRIRDALTVETSEVVRLVRRATSVADTDAFRACLPDVGEDYEARRHLFADRAAALQADFRVVTDRAAMLAEIKSLVKTEGWKKVGSHHAGLTDAACEALSIPVCWTDGGYDTGDLESCDVGMTACEALIAQTGSVLITSRSSGGRALSVLPPHHVVLATRGQLLPDMVAGYALWRQKYAESYPSLISFITGASRTGDIERILVLGAHGPKKLTVLLMES